MIAYLKQLKNKNDFNPGWLGIIINPFFFARLGLHKAIYKLAPQLKGKLLDVGCGHKPYKQLFKVDKYIGMDIEQSGHTHENEDIDIFYDGRTFPFEDNSIDSVLCNQVLEHVFNPSEFLSEINRVLKKDGHFLLSVPFAWDEHEQPFDYARYSSFGLVHLLKIHGFEIVEHIKSTPDIRAILQLLNMFIFKKIGGKNKYQRLVVTIIFLFPINLLGTLLSIFPVKNQDLYLDNVILAKK
jgi:SAM-dependent methyltransferase